MEKLKVTREAIVAYEKRTGFTGIGQFLVEKGLIVVLDEGKCCPKN